MPGSFKQTIQGIKNLERYNFWPEIRILINRINYKYLPAIARYVRTNFQEISRVSIIFLRLTGNAWKNRDTVHINYTESVPFAQQAVDILENKFKVELYHFPKCVLDKKHRQFSKGFTACDSELIDYFEECSGCLDRNNCSGAWIKYKEMEGDDEFSAIS